MDVSAFRFAPLLPAKTCLSLLDLRLLAPLLAQEEPLELLTSWLSANEARFLAGLTYPKRRVEWLGGRLAAKHGLSRLTAAHSSTPYRDYSLLPDAHGRPVLDSPLPFGDSLHVSISHSKHYAAALVTTAPVCGLDIQEKTARLVAVQERITTADERALASAIPDPPTRLALLWTVKEAVKKGCLADHPSFFGAIRVIDLDHDPLATFWTARCLVRDEGVVLARIIEFDNYLLAWVIGADHA